MALRLCITASLFAAIALTACASPEQVRAEDEGRCRSYGFQTGTEAFAQCMQREDLTRRRELYAASCWDYDYRPGLYWP